MITITITGDSASQVQNDLAELARLSATSNSVNTAAPVTEDTPVEYTTEPKKTSKKKSETKKEEAAQQESETETPAEEPAAPATPKYTMEQVRSRAAEVGINPAKKEAFKKLCAEFVPGNGGLSSLDPAKYEDFYNALDQL